jgi:hypothetical protein
MPGECRPECFALYTAFGVERNDRNLSLRVASSGVDMGRLGRATIGVPICLCGTIVITSWSWRVRRQLRGHVFLQAIGQLCAAGFFLPVDKPNRSLSTL